MKSRHHLKPNSNVIKIMGSIEKKRPRIQEGDGSTGTRTKRKKLKGKELKEKEKRKKATLLSNKLVLKTINNK